jgi:hypothetical protein
MAMSAKTALRPPSISAVSISELLLLNPLNKTPQMGWEGHAGFHAVGGLVLSLKLAVA